MYVRGNWQCRSCKHAVHCLYFIENGIEGIDDLGARGVAGDAEITALAVARDAFHQRRHIRPQSARLRIDFDRIGVDALRAGMGGADVGVGHVLGHLVAPIGLLPGGYTRFVADDGRRALPGECGEETLDLGPRGCVFVCLPVADIDDKVLLAAVDNRRTIGAVQHRQRRWPGRAGKRVIAGQSCKQRVGGRVVVGLEFAAAGARGKTTVVQIGFVERIADGIVVALVVEYVEVLHHRGQIGFRCPGHLPHGEAHIAAVDAVVGAAGFDHHHQTDVEQAVVETVDDLHEGVLLVGERRVPVCGIVQNEENVGTLSGDVRVGEKEIGVIVHRVERRIRGERRKRQRGRQQQAKKSLDVLHENSSHHGQFPDSKRILTPCTITARAPDSASRTEARNSQSVSSGVSSPSFLVKPLAMTA